MVPRFKDEVIGEPETIESFHISVGGERMAHMKDERARRKCMERLLPILEEYGIEPLVLETQIIHELMMRDAERLIAGVR